MENANSILVFDRRKLRQQRNRAAARFFEHDALYIETARHLIERSKDIARPFRTILDLGSHNGFLAQHFAANPVQFVVANDCAESMLHAHALPGIVSEEDFLPFAANSFDLVMSNLNLHWVNDLPGALLQIKNVLRPDGLFLAALAGGTTLRELRECLMEAELLVTGGVSPRVSPTIELQTASALLQRAGFALPVVDQEIYTFLYPDAFALMRDLRGMGAANAHRDRLRYPTRRAVLLEAARIYHEKFADPAGGVRAQFDILFLHGWKPDSMPVSH